MLKKEDILHLSALARISISEEEKTELAAEIGSVLEYVSVISGVVTEAKRAPTPGELRGVMREDVEAYSGGEWSEAILANAPHKEDGYFKVGQIM